MRRFFARDDLVDQCYVFVAAAVGYLVHAECFNFVQTAVLKTVGDDPLHTAVHGVPLHAEAFGGLLPAQALRPCGQEVSEHIVLTVLASAHGTCSTLTPQRGQSTRRIVSERDTGMFKIGTNANNRGSAIRS
jgi:hypothetical protein